MNETRPQDRSMIYIAATIVLVFCTYQFLLTPDMKKSINSSIQAVSKSTSKITMSDPGKVIATAAVKATTTVVKVPAKVPPANTVRATVAPVASAVPAAAYTYAVIGSDGCFTATGADGHQFCSDGRLLNPNDPRSQPGFCNNIRSVNDAGQSLGGPTCDNGLTAGILMGAALSDPVLVQATIVAQPEYQEALHQAQEAEGRYTFENECVTANRPDGRSQTVCNPDTNFPWSQGTAASVAASILNGSIPIDQAKGPKG